jgi:hypothetical protein
LGKINYTVEKLEKLSTFPSLARFGPLVLSLSIHCLALLKLSTGAVDWWKVTDRKTVPISAIEVADLNQPHAGAPLGRRKLGRPQKGPLGWSDLKLSATDGPKGENVYRPRSSSLLSGLSVERQLRSLKEAVVHDRLYEILESAISYPGEFIESGIQGEVEADIEIIQNEEKSYQVKYRVRSNSPFLRVYIIQVLRSIFPKGQSRLALGVKNSLTRKCKVVFQLMQEKFYGQLDLTSAKWMDPMVIQRSAGFIGAHLAKELVNRGHEVFGIDNFVIDQKSFTLDAKRNYVSYVLMILILKKIVSLLTSFS